MLPYTVQSGYGRYAVVAFDLDKLKDFDPKGVAEFKAAHGIPEKEPVKRKLGRWSDNHNPLQQHLLAEGG